MVDSVQSTQFGGRYVWGYDAPWVTSHGTFVGWGMFSMVVVGLSSTQPGENVVSGGGRTAISIMILASTFVEKGRQPCRRRILD